MTERCKVHTGWVRVCPWERGKLTEGGGAVTRSPEISYGYWKDGKRQSLGRNRKFWIFFLKKKKWVFMGKNLKRLGFYQKKKKKICPL